MRLNRGQWLDAEAFAACTIPLSTAERRRQFTNRLAAAIEEARAERERAHTAEERACGLRKLRRAVERFHRFVLDGEVALF